MSWYKEPSWKHPIHARGVRSPRYDRAHVGKKLTDKAIQKYVDRGFYEMRGEYLKEKAKRLAEKDFFKMVYDCEKQDFVKIRA